MTFFYDLNKKLADLAKKQDLNESVGSTSGFLEGSTNDYSAKKARAGKDIGKPGKMFSKIAKSAGKEYGSKERGEKVAGAVLAKLRKGVKEDDMEEGNRFTGNLMKARAAGLKKADLDGDGDLEAVREASKPDYIDLDKDGNKKETMKKAAADKKKSRGAGTAFDPEVAKSMFAHKDDSRYDVKDTGYSKRYTRKMQDEPEADDEKSDAPKAKGRPKGSKRAIGAKGPTGRSKLMSKDSIKEQDGVPLVDKGEYDREGEMSKQQIHTIMRAAKKLHSMLSDDDNLPEWVQKKITLAQNYIDGVSDYMASVRAEQGEEQPIAEKAVSVAQRRAAGIAHAAQKGEIPKKELRGASKEMARMPKGELKKFAKTKETGLPEKVKEADAPNEKKSSGGFQFGKGVYESLNNRFKQALTEGMNISVNMNTGPNGEPTKNITVSADGEDAESLAQLLKMAGISGHDESCSTCGSTPCGCESLDENSPDWPTNTEKIDADPTLRTYSGGLNGPKSTGQTTTPVIASQLRRQVSMEESVKLEKDLFNLYQNYKAQ
jgi:hypothetical protein